MTITIKLETSQQVVEVEIQVVGGIEFVNQRAIFNSITGAGYDIPCKSIVRIRPL